MEHDTRLCDEVQLVTEEHYDIDPPKRAEQLFLWYCNERMQETIGGDLYERFIDNYEQYGRRKANRKYWIDVIRFMNRHTLKRSTNSKFNNMSMLSNYFKVGFRNLVRNRAFTAINVLGLSVSMAVCLIIILMINDQLSYDQFHPNKDNIYRFTHDRDVGLSVPMATIPQPLAATVQERFAGFDEITNFHRFSGEVLENGKSIELIGYYTEPATFKMFNYPLRLGNPATVLSEPNSVVLKAAIAEKFFPGENPIGKSMKVGNMGTYKVTGVLEELPGKTHIRFDAFASVSSIPALEKRGYSFRGVDDWENGSSTWTYFSLKEGYSIEQLQPILDGLRNEFYDDNSEYRADFTVQKLTDITPGPLYGNQIGDGMPTFFVYGLAILAGLIIVCAAFNYTNLSAARAMTRTKEVGVRKVMGARRNQLTFQFMVESVLLSLISLVLAFIFIQFLIPAFERLQMSTLLNWDLELTPKSYLQFIGFAVLVGLVTGFFPSLYLASFNVLNAMKGAINKKRLSGWALRKTLIVTQFVISIVLIVSSLLVYKQIRFIVDKDYGYTKENIIVVDLQGQDYDLLKTELEKLPFVEQIAATNSIPNTGVSYAQPVWRQTEDESISMNYYSIDEQYIPELNLELIAGRNFEQNAESLNKTSLIINERALSALGFESPLDALGQTLFVESDSITKNIIGVVKDYNYEFIISNINPLMLRYEPADFQFAQVKILGYDITDEMAQIDQVWNEFDENHELRAKTFQTHQDEFNAFFYDILYIIGLIAVLSISIAAMGLLGISAFAIQARLKEVSIRKVLGANIKSLVLMLSKSFVIMLVIALIIGFTLAYYGNAIWLNMFAYRTSFGFEIFFFTAVGLIGVAVLTIGWQAIKAIGTNPAATLRDD